MNLKREVEQLKLEVQKLRDDLEATNRCLSAHKEWAFRVHEKLQGIYKADPAYKYENRVAFLQGVQ